MVWHGMELTERRANVLFLIELWVATWTTNGGGRGARPWPPLIDRVDMTDAISYLVDPASSHMLVSKIKPCMSKHRPKHGEAANGSL